MVLAVLSLPHSLMQRLGSSGTSSFLASNQSTHPVINCSSSHIIPFIFLLTCFLSGLVYAGVGWAIWRDEKYLPKHLIFELHYLGGTEESYTLNFSRPGAQIIAQYYNLMHLGFKGYQAIMENALSNARLLSRALEATGWYRCVSDIHRKNGQFEYDREQAMNNPYEEGPTSQAYNAGLPVVAFTLTDEFKKTYPHVKQAAVSNVLRAKQYIIPSKYPPITSHSHLS
jgi:glutamate decarboxylase